MYIRQIVTFLSFFSTTKKIIFIVARKIVFYMSPKIPANVLRKFFMVSSSLTGSSGPSVAVDAMVSELSDCLRNGLRVMEPDGVICGLSVNCVPGPPGCVGGGATREGMGGAPGGGPEGGPLGGPGGSGPAAWANGFVSREPRRGIDEPGGTRDGMGGPPTCDQRAFI